MFQIGFGIWAVGIGVSKISGTGMTGGIIAIIGGVLATLGALGIA